MHPSCPSAPLPSDMLSVVSVFFFSSRRRHTRLVGDWEFRRVLFRSSRNMPTSTVNTRWRQGSGSEEPKLKNAPEFSAYCNRRVSPAKEMIASGCRYRLATNLVAWSQPTQVQVISKTRIVLGSFLMLHLW